MIDTINVIHFSAPNQIESFASWAETDGGNDSAELYFIKLVKKLTNLNDEEIDDAITDGIVEFNAGFHTPQSILIVHSTVGSAE